MKGDKKIKLKQVAAGNFVSIGQNGKLSKNNLGVE